MNDTGDFITLCNDRNVNFSVPADLYCITTFSLLEQNRWFEKEIDFIYRYAKPGMVALDIGSNVGVYTLPLAILLGPTGQVFAYEPGTVNRRHLDRSLALNNLSNTRISAAALSNFVGPGILKLGNSGELNQLVASHGSEDSVESVEVSTLDAEMERCHWPQVDFIKLDAEGQEEAILNGGKLFFERYSPLVMFEAFHGRKFAYGLLSAFRDLGFDLYRLLGDGSMLVPVDSDDPLDPFDLNFFAARPELARRMAMEGLLALGCDIGPLSDSERLGSMAHYCQLPIAASLEITQADIEHCPYGDALLAYTGYRTLHLLSPDRRFGLLQAAFDGLGEYCESSNSPAALSTFARIARDRGYRIEALNILRHLCSSNTHLIDMPLFPPSQKFDAVDVLGSEEWFMYAIRETLGFDSNHSAIFGIDLASLENLATSELATADLIKRIILIRLAHGEPLTELASYFSRLDALKQPTVRTWLDSVRLVAPRTQ